MLGIIGYQFKNKRQSTTTYVYRGHESRRSEEAVRIEREQLQSLWEYELSRLGGGGTVLSVARQTVAHPD